MTAPMDDRFDRLGLLVLAVMWALFLIALGAMVFTPSSSFDRPIHPAIAPGVTAVPYVGAH